MCPPALNLPVALDQECHQGVPDVKTFLPPFCRLTHQRIRAGDGLFAFLTAALAHSSKGEGTYVGDSFFASHPEET